MTKIVTFNKNSEFQGFVQYLDPLSAMAALHVSQLREAAGVCENSFYIFVRAYQTKVCPYWICMVTSRFTKLFYWERANSEHVQSGDTLRTPFQHLDNQNIYSSCCTLRLSETKMKDLDVKANSDKARYINTQYIQHYFLNYSRPPKHRRSRDWRYWKSAVMVVIYMYVCIYNQEKTYSGLEIRRWHRWRRSTEGRSSAVLGGATVFRMIVYSSPPPP